MDEIIILLEKLNFSKTEAAVYIDLLKIQVQMDIKLLKI